MQIPDLPADALKDKILLITGAAGRLGGVASKACACYGATVILSDKDLPALENLYDEIVSQGGPEPAIYPIDFAGATEHDYHEVAQTIDREFGILHGLLHGAAAFATLGPVRNIDVRDWSRVLNVNLNAPFLLTRELLGLMQKSGDASIVFTSDSSARKSAAYWGVYGVSKIAVEGFAGILADELDSESKVRVNILLPGPIDSPMRKKAFPAENPKHQAAAESLVKLYIYLLSPTSQGLNGQVLNATDYID